MEGLPIDIWAHFIQYLSPVTYMQLRAALPLIKRRKDKFPTGPDFLRQRVRDALLRRLGAELGQFIIDCFTKYQCYLTGGLLLAIMQGDPVTDDQDVDIFLVDVRRPREELIHPMIDDTRRLSIRHDETLDYDGLPHVVLSFIFQTPTVPCKIQLLVNDTFDEILKHTKSFDFTFCSNMLGNKCFYAKSLESVTKRHCRINVPQYLSSHLGWVERDDAAPLLERLVGRGAKYMSRDYTVAIIPFTEEEAHAALADIVVTQLPGMEMVQNGLSDRDDPRFDLVCKRVASERRQVVAKLFYKTFMN